MGAPLSYKIEGQEFTLPCEVRDASSGAVTYLVPAAAAREMLQGPDFAIAEFLPGKAVCSIAVIDYRDNDLGDYDEVSIAFFVRPKEERAGLPWIGNWIDMFRNRLGVHIVHLPVNQSFTCEAGSKIWGYPKTVQEIDYSYKEDSVTCRLVYNGEHALTITVPRGGKQNIEDGAMTSFSYIDGIPHMTSALQNVEGFGTHFKGVELTLGSGPIADQLRSLGLPKRPMMSVWFERMRGVFGAPKPL